MLRLVDVPRRNGTVVSSAVLAGIAACDAACALALGMVSAGAHDQAVSARTCGHSGLRAIMDGRTVAATPAALRVRARRARVR